MAPLIHSARLRPRTYKQILVLQLLLLLLRISRPAGMQSMQHDDVIGIHEGTRHHVDFDESYVESLRLLQWQITSTRQLNRDAESFCDDCSRSE